MKATRREFLKLSAILTLDLLLTKNIFPRDLEQKITINLPAYSLVLTSNGKEYEFSVGIGKGHGKRETPITEGFVDYKRERVVFRYAKSYPEYGIKYQDIIETTNTYDEFGNPTRYDIPYERIRGLGMKLKVGNEYTNIFVIHSTTEEYAIGTPVSDGCIRLSIEDMLQLYGLVCPEIRKGKLAIPVPVKIIYNVMELKQKDLIVHANVYHKKIDYVFEFKETMNDAGFDLSVFDYNIVEQELYNANQEFDDVHKQILNLHGRNHPHSYVPNSLKERLHKGYYISDFFK